MRRTEKEVLLLHLCQRQAWETALVEGEYRATSLDKEGFIHCSLERQILGVANEFYRHVPDLVLLWINPGQVRSKIVFERPAGETGELFPHVYGPLDLEAVFSVVSFPIQEDGYYRRIPPPISSP